MGIAHSIDFGAFYMICDICAHLTCLTHKLKGQYPQSLSFHTDFPVKTLLYNYFFVGNLNWGKQSNENESTITCTCR
jgi:hypothetical protein